MLHIVKHMQWEAIYPSTLHGTGGNFEQLIRMFEYLNS